jgi:GT2 family glycosyltransferase
LDIEMTAATVRAGFVAIGRNEGERLRWCLRSMPDGYPVVYVDSGSTDGSVVFAQSLGMQVEILSTDVGFTAARARNVGWRRLLADNPDLAFVQFVDGDCELAPDWLAKAEGALDFDPGLCAVFGRRRERFPQASFYNALCDDEWNVPIGLVEACGGDALFRAEALQQVGGYDDTLIAGEEPDLCLRLGREGWKVRRIDAEMTLHDADIHHARQQWLRARRAGHAFAEHVARHGPGAFASWRRQRNSIILWGAVVPLLILIAVVTGLMTGSWPLIGISLLMILTYPAQVVRIGLRKWRSGASLTFALGYGLWMMLGKFAQFGGLVRYYMRLRGGRPVRLIEYKSASESRS